MAILVPIILFVVIVVSTTMLGKMGIDAIAEGRKD